MAFPARTRAPGAGPLGGAGPTPSPQWSSSGLGARWGVHLSPVGDPLAPQTVCMSVLHRWVGGQNGPSALCTSLLPVCPCLSHPVIVNSLWCCPGLWGRAPICPLPWGLMASWDLQLPSTPCLKQDAPCCPTHPPQEQAAPGEHARPALPAAFSGCTIWGVCLGGIPSSRWPLCTRVRWGRGSGMDGCGLFSLN